MSFARRISSLSISLLSRSPQTFPVSSLLLTRQTVNTATTAASFSKTVRSHHCVTPSSTTTTSKPRHFLAISDLTQDELANLVQRAAQVKEMIKKQKQLNYPLRYTLSRQTVAIMFSKRSTRTRISTEGAIVHMGGHPMFLGKEDIQLGINESMYDTSKVISSMTSCMVARVGDHSDIVELAAHSSVPVINALSDSYHPLQAVADILTIKEAFPQYFPIFTPPSSASSPAASTTISPSKPLKLAWVGDANNVLYDLMTACGKSGISIAIATPKQYPMNLDMLETARQAADVFGNGAVISVGTNPEEAVNGADIIVTDTWISMGQESEKQVKLQQFSGYQVSTALATRGGANPDWKFMHCLPRKPEEVTDEVFYDEKRSLVWTEAENRLYAAIAALEAFVVNRGKVCFPEKGLKEKVKEKDE